MSESVKIGGIGKNPAIDEISSLDFMGVKAHARNQMEQFIMGGDLSERYTRQVPIDFSKVDWKGKA